MPESVRQGVELAEVALPADSTASGQAYFGHYADIPALSGKKVPVVFAWLIGD